MALKRAAAQRLFNRIADRYDLMNRLMTMGRHDAWCREVAALARVPLHGSVLDVATGTGAIALAVKARHPGATVHAVDIAPRMIARAAAKPGADGVEWRYADANDLPFADASFDAVTHGYLLRNVEDRDRVIREQRRVLKPGGRLVLLETCPPRGPLRVPVAFGVRVVPPLLGRLVARDRESYTYLQESSLKFQSPEAVAAMLGEQGFAAVAWRRRFLGTQMIVSAAKA